MKKKSTLNSKVLSAILALNLSSVSFATTRIIPIPKGASTEIETPRDSLNGATIASCQKMMGASWKKTTDINFDEYMKVILTKAAKAADQSLYENMPDATKYKIIEMFSEDREFYNQLIQSGGTTVKSDSGGSPTAVTDGKNREEPQGFKEFTENREATFNTYNKTAKKALNNIKECIALHTIISNAKRVRNMEYEEYNKSQSTTSSDKVISCSSIGYETQDYKACSEASTYYDVVFYSRKAVETVQSLQYMDSTMDIQTDLAANAQTDATAGLKAQRQDMKEKAGLARTRAAAETAAIAALYTALEKIPSLDDMTNECEVKIRSSKYTNAYSTAYNIYLNDAKEFNKNLNLGKVLNEDTEGELSSACNTYVTNVGETASHALIQNSRAKEAMQQALIDAGMNVVTNLGTAEIFDKQADRIGDAIDLVDDYDPEALAYDSEDLQTTECLADPTSENCVSAQYERGVGYHSDGINVSGLQFATSDSTLPIDEFDRNTDAASDSTNRTNSVGAIGAPIDSIDKAGGLADAPIGAASVSSTGSNGIGSGGGGGGSGGGGASAPANGSASTGGQGADKAYVGSSKKLKYSSSGSGLSFSSGSIRTASKTKAANPFSNLFGKKTTKTDGVLNFRGVASSVGSKNGSIFQMISKRYSAVSKDKRLEEYQKTE